MKTLHLLPILALSACASITTGTTQAITVSTIPKGAECNLTNDKGSWYVKDTPATATVTRSYSDLTATCTKGKLAGSGSLSSTTQASSFGNILAGGIIGAAVDMSSGAAYGYPTTLQIDLE